MNLGKIRVHNKMENDFLQKFKCCTGILLQNYAKFFKTSSSILLDDLKSLSVVQGFCCKINHKWIFLKTSSSILLDDLLGSKTLGTKCIKTSICIMLANHDQNI